MVNVVDMLNHAPFYQTYRLNATRCRPAPVTHCPSTLLVQVVFSSNQIRRNIFLRYIQNRTNHRTSSTAAASTAGSKAWPRNSKTWGWKTVWRLDSMKPEERWARTYMVIEFMPTTTRGKAQRRQPERSITS